MVRFSPEKLAALIRTGNDDVKEVIHTLLTYERQLKQMDAIISEHAERILILEAENKFLQEKV